MEDASNIQKLNDTAQELENFGFFDETNEVVVESTKTLLSDNEQTESKIFSTPNQLMEELEYSFNRFKEKSDAQIEEMSSSMSALTSQIKELTETVSALKNMNKVTQSPQKASESQIQEDNKNNKSQERSEMSNQELAVEKAEVIERPYNERQGHYTSEDVKVEDIFYCGQTANN